MYKLDIPDSKEFPELLAIWEASVRATHHFLQPGDIAFFRDHIEKNKLFEQVCLTCLRNAAGEIVGFMGTNDDSLEMLFINPQLRNQGIGRLLLQHAINHWKIKKVDVNEQNEHAVGFYEHFGFRAVARSAVDGTGRPYPILHMELK